MNSTKAPVLFIHGLESNDLYQRWTIPAPGNPLNKQGL